MKRSGLWAAVLFALAFLGWLLHSTLGLRRFRVEVCMEYHGRSACRVASGATHENALRTATENACAQISSGMTDSMACDRTPPTRITWLEGR